MKVLLVFHCKEIIYHCTQEWQWSLILKMQAWNTPESASTTAEHVSLLIKLTASLFINLKSQMSLRMRGGKKSNNDNNKINSTSQLSHLKKIVVSCPIKSLWKKKAITQDSAGEMTSVYWLQKMTCDTGSVALWRWRWLLSDFASCCYFYLFSSQSCFWHLLKWFLHSTCRWR